MLSQDFIRRTKELLQNEYNALESALDMQPPVSFRINPCKSPVEFTPTSREPMEDDIATTLHNPGKTPGRHENVPWCLTGYYLPERPSFTFDPLFHAGSYYVQEASSMFLEQVIAHIINEDNLFQDKITALDLCAAPGGKSTHLQALLPERSFLVSNEIIQGRSMILAENMTKWGSPRHMTTNNDPKHFGNLKHVFDIILADLPCSGEGMFRKDFASRDEWSVENVKLCASRQKRIIYDVWDALRPGGWLIYSTCTFNTEENEENVHELANELGAEIIPVPIKAEWNITGSLHHHIPVYRFFPHRTRGEGFFLALMRKKREPEHKVPAITKDKDSKQPVTVPAGIKHLLTEPGKFAFFTDGKSPAGTSSGKPSKTISGQQAGHHQITGRIYAIPEEHKDIYLLLARHLKIISAGIILGEYKGKDFIPSVSLALSTKINPNAFPSVDLPYDNAIKYLQKESVILPENTPKGYILLTYRHIPLGFAKNIENRANNLYPREWRIRSRQNPLL